MIELARLVEYQARSAEHYKFAIDARMRGMKHDVKHGALFAAEYSAWLRSRVHYAIPLYSPLEFQTLFYYVVVDGTLMLIEGERVKCLASRAYYTYEGNNAQPELQ